MSKLADEFLSSHNCKDKVKFMELNFFTDDYPKVDVIVLGHVLHMFPAERRQILLDRAFKALKKGGAVIQIDFNVAENKKKYSMEDLASQIVSAQMQWLEHGFERTIQDDTAALKKAGFRNMWSQRLGVDTAIIGYKL